MAGDADGAVLSRTRPLSTIRRRSFLKAPEFEQRLPSCNEVQAGQTVSLECIIDAIPKPAIRWYKDGCDITDDERYIYEQDCDFYQVIIEDVGKDDEGTYKVKATNKEGETASISYLEVKGKKKKKVKHVRSVSVPASFPTITEITVVEDEEEAELEDIAPSPLSRRLRSTRGSLRKEHTWPRVLKALPTECAAYVGEATSLSEREYEGTESEDDSPDMPLPIPEFPNHIESQILETQLAQEHVRQSYSSPVLRTPEEEVEIQKARDIWRELERLNEAEKMGIVLDDVTESSFVLDQKSTENNKKDISSALYEVCFGADGASIVDFHTVAIPTVTFFGLWMNISPLYFVLCILILAFMRCAVLVYLAAT
ncbi:obscurin-like [Lineus longissimus]|uniref:obscurin-like n=1 Tax=Lineus longissimus TaxID=88925 RepID=UPI002B4D8A63